MPLRRARSGGSHAAPHEAILDVYRDRNTRQTYKSFQNSNSFGLVTFRKPRHDSDVQWSEHQYLAANLFKGKLRFGVWDRFCSHVALGNTGWRELLYHNTEPSRRLMTIYSHFIYLCLSQLWLYYRLDKFPESFLPVCHALHASMVTPRLSVVV
jgi:hypothetical protein